MDEPTPGWQIRYCLLVLVDVTGFVALCAYLISLFR